MKTKYILYLLSLVFLLSSCWKEDLKNCWMGDVTLTIVNPEKPDVPLNKNDAFQKVQKRRVQEKR